MYYTKMFGEHNSMTQACVGLAISHRCESSEVPAAGSSQVWKAIMIQQLEAEWGNAGSKRGLPTHIIWRPFQQALSLLVSPYI